MAKTKTARVPNDFYPTEAALTRYLLKVMGGEILGKVEEPCAGELDIVSEMTHIQHDQREGGSFSWEVCPVCQAGHSASGYGGMLFYPVKQ